MTDRGRYLLTRRDLGGLAVAALFGMAAPASANTAAEDYVTAIASDVMQLANTGQKGPALRSRFAALMNRPAFGPYMVWTGSNKAYEPAALAVVAFGLTWGAMGLLQLAATLSTTRRAS